jgi:hypothetical protein
MAKTSEVRRSKSKRNSAILQDISLDCLMVQTHFSIPLGITRLFLTALLKIDPHISPKILSKIQEWRKQSLLSHGLTLEMVKNL